MQIKFISFFDYQKTACLANQAKPIFIDPSVKYNSITSKALIDHISNDSQFDETNSYYDIIYFINMEKIKSNTQKRIDTFSVYFSILFGFTIGNKLVLSLTISSALQHDLAFFMYYNKAFVNDINHSRGDFNVNKYTRFDYQSKLQIRRNNHGYNPLFSQIFKGNNHTLDIEQVLHVPNTKLKLRSIKDETTNLITVKEGFHLVKQIRNCRSKNVTARFAWKISYRSTKQLKQVSKSKWKSKVLGNQFFYSSKNIVFQKLRRAWSLQFKIIPTEYKESSVNTNKFAQFKSLISLILTAQFSFYQVNALSLTRFAFDYQLKDAQKTIKKKIKFSQKFLESYERELMSRFRGVGLFFKDLVRVSFFARYIKKADFIASFFASTITKLPRNRKELKFVRFLIKVLKTAASQNESIIGVRIRFQGRVNRWRRTKHILGIKGNIGYFSYANRIEYGIAQAITRKGTLGVHIWICYKPGASLKFSKVILDYINLDHS